MVAQFLFITKRLSTREYNCSAHSPKNWSRLYGEKQYLLGVWSICVGISAAVLYTPAIRYFSRLNRFTSITIMRLLAINDLFGIVCVGTLFGIQMLEGAVFCSHRKFVLAAELGAYACWNISSCLCVFLIVNRILELTGRERLFQGARCTFIMAGVVIYGISAVLFIPPVLTNSVPQCMHFCPYIPSSLIQYGVKQYKFGTYSLVFGVVTEILYVPCTLGLRNDLKTSCFNIMFWLSILDMIAIMANSVLFGILLLQGTVYCSNPTLTMGVGILAYYVWCTCEMLGFSNLFTSAKTNIYLAICTAYGLFMAFFTRHCNPCFFSPFISGHGLEEYVNLSHLSHNIVIAASSCLLYMTLTAVIVVKSRMIVAAEGSRSRVINNIPVFAQVMLIMFANLIGTLIYAYMNFMAAPPAFIVTGQVAWQFIHGKRLSLNIKIYCFGKKYFVPFMTTFRTKFPSEGSPPFIYLALNKTIRQFALHSIGLDRIFNTYSTRVVALSSTRGSTSRN